MFFSFIKLATSTKPKKSKYFTAQATKIGYFSAAAAASRFAAAAAAARSAKREARFALFGCVAA